MPNWKYEITHMRVLEVRPGSMELGRPGKIPSETMETMQKQLQGDEWEVVDHKFSRVDDEVLLSVMWRKPSD